MPNTTLERRMELIKQARELSSRNKDTINGVQKLVDDAETEQVKLRTSLLGLKILVAVILFASYVFMDKTNAGNLLLTSDDISKAISYNIDVNSVVEEVFSQFQN